MKTMDTNDPQWADMALEELNLITIISAWNTAYLNDEFIEDDSPEQTTEKD
jgi:hypothetical protein